MTQQIGVQSCVKGVNSKGLNTQAFAVPVLSLNLLRFPVGYKERKRERAKVQLLSPEPWAIILAQFKVFLNSQKLFFCTPMITSAGGCPTDGPTDPVNVAEAVNTLEWHGPMADNTFWGTSGFWMLWVCGDWYTPEILHTLYGYNDLPDHYPQFIHNTSSTQSHECGATDYYYYWL